MTKSDTNVFHQLMSVIEDRKINPPAESYTTALFQGGLEKIGAKLTEEAGELIEAQTSGEAAWEAADVIFFALTDAIKKGASLEDIERELDRRAMKVTRRPGNAKPGHTKENES